METAATAAGASLSVLGAFGTITGARAQTPIDSRTVLPIPQARVTARDARAPTIQPLRAPQGAPNTVIVFVFSTDDATAIGIDSGSPVTEDYGDALWPLHGRDFLGANRILA